MISSVFGKTKPVNYVILICSTFLLYVLVNLNQNTADWTPIEWGKQLLVLACLFFEVFLINFIVQRNQITKANTYTVLLYTVLFLIFPETLANPDGVFCSLFVLLALRRLISIRSLKSTHYKIFDATLWLAIASLFYPWALLYILLVWSVVYLFEPKVIQNWLLPFSAILAVALVYVATLLLLGKMDLLSEHFDFSFGSTDSLLERQAELTKVGIVMAASFVLGVMAYVRLNKSGQAQLLIMRIIGLHFLLSILVIGFSFMHGNPPMILLFFPVAVLFTRYIESLRKTRLKDGIFFLLIGVAIAVFIIQLVVK